jgi:HlyD family secretion protein
MKPFFIFLIMLIVVSCKQSIEKTNPTIENISESVYASGIVKSKNQYQVYSIVNGLIQEIMVAEGDFVKKGEPLVRILNEPSQLNASNAKLASDFAELSSNADKLKAARVSSELAYNKLKNDSLLFVRQKILRSQGVGSLVELEQRELAYKSALTNYEISLMSYRDLKRQLEFASHQAKNNLKLSDALARDFTIKADADGRIYKILKEKGELVNTLSPVAIMGDATDFLLELKVDEFDIARLREGQKVLFTMDSYKGEVFEASVVKIEPLMNDQSKSFTVNAKFVSKPNILYPNLTVEANIVVNTKEKAVTIPRSYLIGDSLVLVNKDEKRKVTIGLKDYQKVEIESGLTINDVIYKPKP